MDAKAGRSLPEEKDTLMDGIACMNCKKPVNQNEGEFFAQVFVCKSCNTIAKSFYERLERELKHLLTFAKDGIRVALIEGNFNLSEASAKEELSKKELLEEILRMEQAREARAKTVECHNIQATPSGENTPPHVSTLAALGRSGSNKPSPQG